MEFKQLRSLLTVAEMGSVSGAARVLHYAQPAVTRQIQILEDEFGVPLFERSRLGMSLTPAGEMLAERARRAIAELEQAKSEIRPASELSSGKVRLGLLESLLDILADPVVTAVSKHCPRVELQLVTAYSGNLQRWLDEGELDLSVLYNLQLNSSMSTLPLIEEELWAVAPAEARLSPDIPVTPATVLTHPLVLPPPGRGLRALIDQILQSSQVQASSFIEVNSLALQKGLVRTGHGWTILPAAGVIADIRSGVLSGAPLTNPSITRKIVLGMPRINRVPVPILAVANEIRAVVKQLITDGFWPGVSAKGSSVSSDLERSEGLSA